MPDSQPRNRLVSEILHALRSGFPISRNHRERELIADWRFEPGEWDALLAMRPERRILRVFRAIQWAAVGLFFAAIVPLYGAIAPTLGPRRDLAFIGPKLPAHSTEQIAFACAAALAFVLLAALVYRVVDRYALAGRAVRVRVYPFGIALNSHLMRWDGPGERVKVETLPHHPHGLVFSLLHPNRWDPMRVSVFRVALLAPDVASRDRVLERWNSSVK